jgi:hypothetical protein
MVKKCEGSDVTVPSSNCTGSITTAIGYNQLDQLSSVAKAGISAQSYGYDDQGRSRAA